MALNDTPDRSTAHRGLPPIGVNLTSIGVSSRWWLETASLLEAAGFQGVWCWDHFLSRGRRREDPVLECWTMLAAAAARTSRLRVGSFVLNVMNRHPAVLARMAATLAELSGGRLDIGIGIGGHPAEITALGIPFPAPTERLERLAEAIDVLRALFSGGPVDYAGRHFRLHEAWAHPVPDPAPRLIVAGQTAAGTRLAARAADGWTSDAPHFAALVPVYEEALAEAGRARRSVVTIASPGPERGSRPGDEPLFADLAGEAMRWRELGADELVLSWIRPVHVPALLAAAERAGLS